jgi:hypothetical protein
MVLYLKNTMKLEFFENEIYSYITEGIGNILPLNVDFL